MICLRSHMPQIPTYLPDINWDEFLKLVMHHRVYPQVFKVFKKWDSQFISQAVFLKIESLYTKNLFRMLQLTKEMVMVSRSFAEQNIPLIILKGPILALELYGDISQRTSKDLDILCDIGDVDRSIELLLSLGYDLTDERLLSNWMNKMHHLSFYNPDSNMQVELHWKLNPNLELTLPFRELWRRKQTKVISNQEVNYLSNEDLLLYLSEHGSRHGWFRLKWLMDIDRLVISKKIDVINLKVSLEQYKVMHYLIQSTTLSQHLLLTDIPVEIIGMPLKVQRSSRNLHKIIESIKISHQGKNNPSQYEWFFFLWMSTRQKFYYLRNLLKPSSKDARMLPLARDIHFMYFLLRPFLLIWRAVNRKL